MLQRYCALVTIEVLSLARAFAQGKPPEIPRHVASVAAGAHLTVKRTIETVVTSRRASDPAKPEVLVALRRKAVTALMRTPLIPVDTPASAQLTLELIIEPHERWGMYHHQNDPYVFLLLRDRASAHLLYCAYQRYGILHSASSVLLHEFVEQAQGKASLPVGDIRACAKEAMRPRNLDL